MHGRPDLEVDTRRRDEPQARPGGGAAATPSNATESGAAANPSPCLPDTGFLRRQSEVFAKGSWTFDVL